MTCEKKDHIEVKDGFRVSDTIEGCIETRYGWSGSVCETTSREQFEDCIDDAEWHGLGYVEIEFNVEEFNEIWAFLTFSPNPGRGRISLEALKSKDMFIDFYNGVIGFIKYDLGPINADTSLAMSRLYDGERYNDSVLHCEASSLASRLTEIARSWIESLKDSATDDDMKKLIGNATLETCEMTRWSKLVKEMIS